jgi:para-aminobenzoate synthetase / 4-amino-4-deoxychorismate lyase
MFRHETDSLTVYKPIPAEYRARAAVEPDSVLLETTRFDNENYRSFLFTRPVEVFSAKTPAELAHVFSHIENGMRKGFYAAGFVAYDPAPGTGKVLQEGITAWFGLYRDPGIFDHRVPDGADPGGTESGENGTSDSAAAVENVAVQFGSSKGSDGREKYCAAVDSIREHIAQGDVYQMNYTGRIHFGYKGSARILYERLLRNQRTPYAALLNCGGMTILSFTPELFFRKKGEEIIVRPMKGTVSRGMTTAEDDRLASWLAADSKNRAENIMIVDVLRNDLGKIARWGSVETGPMCTIEKYDSLFQMTSTVRARLRTGMGPGAIFDALFPSGSVTGAPKLRAMQLIGELEDSPRGVYTGAIGYFGPDGSGVFSVAIRTLTIENGFGTMGTGSGIVWDSDPDVEYDECILKSRFLTGKPQDHELIETLLWSDGYPMIDGHIRRLADSARYFDYPFSASRVRRELGSLARGFAAAAKYRVRMRLDRWGRISLETARLEEERLPLRAGISERHTDSHEMFLRHKTTRRELYDEAYRRATSEGLADYIFTNERGEVTEGAVSNIFLLTGDSLVTPPLHCGLLNGVYRQHVINTQPGVRQEIIRLSDLAGADAIYLCNAVRGMRKVTLVP